MKIDLLRTCSVGILALLATAGTGCLETGSLLTFPDQLLGLSSQSDSGNSSGEVGGAVGDAGQSAAVSSQSNVSSSVAPVDAQSVLAAITSAAGGGGASRTYATPSPADLGVSNLHRRELLGLALDVLATQPGISTDQAATIDLLQAVIQGDWAGVEQAIVQNLANQVTASTATTQQ